MKSTITLILLFTVMVLSAQVHEATNGNVGIGTNTPQTKLTIKGLDTDGWNSGIGLLRSGVDGRILVDTDGMKFRIMTTGKDFVFRNSLNQNVLRIKGNGNVGIGTTYPQAGLEVKRSSNIGGKWNVAGSIFRTSEGANSLIMDTNEVYGSGTLYLGSRSGDIMRLRTVTDTGNTDRVIFKGNGDVGIGTTSPEGKLHVSSAISGDAIFRLEADRDNNNESDNPMMQFRQDGGQIGVNIGYSEENFGSNIFGIGTRYSNQETWDVFTINTSNGNVGIGTKNAGPWRLAVKGKIRAEEIKVETDWADYVFEKGYDLPTLEEVQKHIQDKGHLINIPSAKEVAEKGIELGEMNKLLLEKIEELTLYTIQQQDLINKILVENIRQQKEISELKTAIK